MPNSNYDGKTQILIGIVRILSSVLIFGAVYRNSKIPQKIIFHLRKVLMPWIEQERNLNNMARSYRLRNYGEFTNPNSVRSKTALRSLNCWYFVTFASWMLCFLCLGLPCALLSNSFVDKNLKNAVVAANANSSSGLLIILSSIFIFGSPIRQIILLTLNGNSFVIANWYQKWVSLGRLKFNNPEWPRANSISNNVSWKEILQLRLIGVLIGLVLLFKSINVSSDFIAIHDRKLKWCLAASVQAVDLSSVTSIKHVVNKIETPTIAKQKVINLDLYEIGISADRVIYTDKLNVYNKQLKNVMHELSNITSLPIIEVNQLADFCTTNQHQEICQKL